MSLAALVAAAAALALLPPVLAYRLRRSHPARLVMLSMLHLLGLVLVPVAVVACALQLLIHRGPGSLFPDAIGVALIAVVVGKGTMAAGRVRRTWQSVAAALPAAGTPGPHQSTIVTLDTPTAFAAGRRVVVSTALVEILDPSELDAVIAHEQAHVDRGHGRVAALAAALTAAAWNVPLARRSLRNVREGLELLADTDAVRQLPSSGPIASAVAKLSAHDHSAPCPAGNSAFLDRRLGCLAAPAPVTSPTSRAVDVIAALVGAGIVVTVCGALHLHLAAVGVLVCLGGAGALWYVLRPLRLVR